MSHARRLVASPARPHLLTLTGVGPIVAATVLAAWSYAGRCRDDGAFAMLAGTAPIPASPRKTVRYRLNRSGDRQLNRAVYTVNSARTCCSGIPMTITAVASWGGGTQNQ